MTKSLTAGLLACLLLFANVPRVLASDPLTQIQSFNCDFDDNIFYTGAKIWIYDTVQRKEIGVSTADWAVVKNKLGRDGVYKNCVLRPDGLREFGDASPEGKGLFRKQ